MWLSVAVRANIELVPIGPKVVASFDISQKHILVIFAFSIFIGTVNLFNSYKSVE